MRGRWNVLVAALVCALPLTVAACGNNGPPDFALSLASGQPAAATITQGGTAQSSIPGSGGERLDGQHHAGVERAAAGRGRCAGLGDSGDWIAADVYVLSAASNAPVTSAPVTLTATGVSGNPLSSSSITHTQTVTLSVVARRHLTHSESAAIPAVPEGSEPVQSSAAQCAGMVVSVSGSGSVLAVAEAQALHAGVRDGRRHGRRLGLLLAMDAPGWRLLGRRCRYPGEAACRCR